MHNIAHIIIVCYIAYDKSQVWDYETHNIKSLNNDLSREISCTKLKLWDIDKYTKNFMFTPSISYNFFFTIYFYTCNNSNNLFLLE